MWRKLKMDDGCITNYLKLVKKIHISKVNIESGVKRM